MSLKKDASGRRWVELEIDLPGTPEEIWQMMATGPGTSAWFVPTDIEEREGGAVTFHFGGDLTSSGYVTTWQPPVRFGYEEVGWSGDAPPLATEIVIEAKSGGICTVRMVHSLFTDKAEWDRELEGILAGWPPFFGILRIYLRSFAGMRAASARLTGTFDGEADKAWRYAEQALGLAGSQVGQTRDTSVNGSPRLVGVVEDVTVTRKSGAMTLRLEQPSAGIAMVGAYGWGGQSHISLSLFFYGDDAEAILAHEAPKWEAWMADHLNPPMTGR